jgi:hypothetical protein
MSETSDKNLIERFRKTIPYNDSANRTIYCKNHITPEISLACQNILHSNDLKLITRFLAGFAKVCPVCGKYHIRQGKTCSDECTVISRKNTNLQKYGCENVLSNQDIQKKCIENTKKKYGVTENITNVSQIKDIQNKIKSTNLAKYGKKWYVGTQDRILKTKKRMLEKYGVDSYNKTDVYKRQVQETNLAKYGVPWNIRSDASQAKVKETCLEHFGTETFFSSSEHASNTKKRAYQNFIERLKELNVKNFQDVNVLHLHSYIEEHNGSKYFNATKCSDHFGISRYIVDRMKCIHGINVPNYIEKGKSIAENVLFNMIPTSDKFCNVRNIISPLEIDLYIPKYKLAIEYDGIYYHSSDFKDKNYHLNKTIACNNKGIQLFHIFESDDIDIWKSMINNKLKLNTRVYARKCLVKEISYNDAKTFCLQNHLQGACNSKINLGLFYNDELLEVMTFGKSRFNKHYEYELLRLCTKKYYSVIGGASKLFKYFKQTYKPNSIISYANRRFSNGSIYETLGFKFINKTKPNYFYVHSSSFVKVSRISAQKHKLKTFLKKYDVNLSERENMSNNGYLQIFDCGNLVYEYIA